MTFEGTNEPGVFLVLGAAAVLAALPGMPGPGLLHRTGVPQPAMMLMREHHRYIMHIPPIVSLTRT